MLSDMAKWTRVGEEIVSRMQTMSVDAATVARTAGVSDTIVGHLINARKTSYRPTTLAAVDRALGWTVGSIARIADGGRPEIKVAAADAAVGVTWPVQLGDLPPNWQAAVKAVLDAYEASL